MCKSVSKFYYLNYHWIWTLLTIHLPQLVGSKLNRSYWILHYET